MSKFLKVFSRVRMLKTALIIADVILALILAFSAGHLDFRNAELFEIAFVALCALFIAIALIILALQLIIKDAEDDIKL